jgi:hypothetical protein
MNDEMARDIQAIRILVTRLVAALCPPEAEAKKPVSAASVSSVTKLADGTVVDGGDLDGMPSQLEHDLVEAGEAGKMRRVVRIKNRAGDPR